MSDVEESPSVKESESLSLKDHMDYAWKHFALLADQRMRTFNFYVAVLTALVAITLTTLSKKSDDVQLQLLGFGHAAFGILFLLIDYRSRKLIDVAAVALRSFENSSAWRGEKLLMAVPKPRHVGKIATYTGALWLAYFTQIFFGLSLMYYTVL